MGLCSQRWEGSAAAQGGHQAGLLLLGRSEGRLVPDPVRRAVCEGNSQELLKLKPKSI